MLVTNVFAHFLEYCRASISLSILSLILSEMGGNEESLMESVADLKNQAENAANDIRNATPMGGASNPNFYGVIPFTPSPVIDEHDSFLAFQSKGRIDDAFKDGDYVEALKLLKDAPHWPPLLLPFLIRRNYIGIFTILANNYRPQLRAYLEDDRTADECQIVEAFRRLVADSGVFEARYIQILRSLGWKPSARSAYVLFDLALKHNWMILWIELIEGRWVHWNMRLEGHYGSPLIYAAQSGRAELMARLQYLPFGVFKGEDLVDLSRFEVKVDDKGESWLPDIPLLATHKCSGILGDDEVEEEDQYLPKTPPTPAFNRTLRSVSDPNSILIDQNWSALKIALANTRFREGKWDASAAVLGKYGAKGIEEHELRRILDESVMEFGQCFAKNKNKK